MPARLCAPVSGRERSSGSGSSARSSLLPPSSLPFNLCLATSLHSPPTVVHRPCFSGPSLCPTT
eukprot:286778-Rhodomonas_salina.1